MVRVILFLIATFICNFAYSQKFNIKDYRYVKTHDSHVYLYEYNNTNVSGGDIVSKCHEYKDSYGNLHYYIEMIRVRDNKNVGYILIPIYMHSGKASLYDYKDKTFTYVNFTYVPHTVAIWDNPDSKKFYILENFID